MNILYPLSFAQQRLLFLEKNQPDTSVFNIAYSTRLIGNINEFFLKKSFEEVTQRHEILRTSFITNNGQSYLEVHDSIDLDFEVLYLSEQPNETQYQRAIKLSAEAAEQTFNLEKPPLFKVKLYDIGSQNKVLTVIIHHIISDAWSLHILYDELEFFYQSFLDKAQRQLNPLNLQYKEFAENQREQISGDYLKDLISFWKGHLKNAPNLTGLPTVNERSAIQKTVGKKMFFELDQSLTEDVEQLSKQANGTLFMTLLGTFAILVQRYTNSENLVIGTPVTGRNNQELEGLIGLFVNLLPITLNIDSKVSILHFLREVRTTFLDAYMHQGLPFDKLVQELHPKRSLSYNPIVQIVFSYLDEILEKKTFANLQSEPLEIPRTVSKFDLELHLKKENSIVKGYFLFNCQLFDEGFIQRMINHYKILLREMVELKDKPISTINILTKEEFNQIIEWGNNTVDFPETNVVELFKTQLRNRPNELALISKEESLTFSELDERSNILANFLRSSKGISKNQIIGLLFTERSINLVVAILSIWKSGAAYVPLDSKFPEERTWHMIKECDVTIILSLDSDPIFSNKDVDLVIVDEIGDTINNINIHDIEIKINEEDLAYIIYTSGSNGKPKGVRLPHSGLTNLVQVSIPLMGIEAGSRIIQFASINFDASVWEISVALASGATLCIGTNENLLPGYPVVEFLKNNKINHAFFPPSTLAVLPEEDLPDLKNIVVGGEVCSLDLVKRWGKGRTFFNGYGPTEATIFTTFEKCNFKKGKISIGHPIPNVQTYILNGDLNLNPVGIPGELYIAGKGLAKGYLKNEELTKEKFIYCKTLNKTLYKTGDIARYESDGRINYLGRIDKQVKIRGFRVELSEIEFHLNQYDNVKESIVVEREFNGRNTLIGYVKPFKIEPLLMENLRTLLKKQLPEYMIPSFFITLESFPLTSNGKLDINSLPLPNTKITSRKSDDMPSEGKIERVIANIWEEILNVKNIGMDDNFFDIGGHSLLIAFVIAKMEKIFAIKIPVLTIFKYPTIRSIGKFIKNGEIENKIVEKSKSRAEQRMAAISKKGFKRNE